MSKTNNKCGSCALWRVALYHPVGHCHLNGVKVTMGAHKKACGGYDDGSQSNMGVHGLPVHHAKKRGKVQPMRRRHGRVGGRRLRPGTA